MPKVQYRSNCKPSTFAYPPALEVPKEKEKEKVRAEELSCRNRSARFAFLFPRLLVVESCSSRHIDLWIIFNPPRQTHHFLALFMFIILAFLFIF